MMQNGGKLNSHVWFFRLLCPLLRPRYCFLLDAGTVPEPQALLRLYASMEENKNIGGIAGEICVDRQQQVSESRCDCHGATAPATHAAA